MSRLGVWLVEWINGWAPPQAMHQELSQHKLSIEAYQEREYQEAARLCPEFGPRWKLAGQKVLDVGSGLGGKAAFYLDQGAASVTAVDLRPVSLQASQRLAARRAAGGFRPALADAAGLPFPADSFDVIMSFNTLEHVADLRATLAECRRVLRPGGLMFFHFPPFYSPWGAHLEGWINFPWPHVFFADRTLIEAARRVEARRRNNVSYIAPAQVDWEQAERLPDLNRATVREVLEHYRVLKLRVLQADLLPFARHYLANKGWLGRAALALLMWVTTWPLAREVLTTKMVFVLSKDA